ncbi:PAS domain S-box protein [Persephonella sp.]
MLRILSGLILIAVTLIINIYYHGIRQEINYPQLIPNVIALLAALIGYYLTHKLKNMKSVYFNINFGFIFLIISQTFLVSYFLTNQNILTLSISEIFIKLPGIILILAGFVQWLRVKEEREQMLKEQEEKWKSIVEGVNDIIIIIQDRQIKYINTKIKDLLGYSPSEILGKSVLQFISEEDLERLTSNNSKKVLHLKSKNGEERIFEVNPSVIPYEGKPAFLGIMRDITDKVIKERELIRAKERIEEIKEKLHEAQKLAKVGYWEVYLPDMRFYLSDEAVEIFCSSSDKCSYDFNDFLQIVLPDYREEIKSKREKAIKHHIPYETEYRVKTPAGIKIIREKVKILKEHRKDPVVLGIVQDVTEIHMVYQQVLENEERYRNLFEYSNDAIVISDMDGNILDINQKAMYKLGYSKFDLKILNIKDIFEERFRRVYPEWLKRLYINGYMRFETEVVTSEKRRFPAEVSASIFEIKDKKYIQLIIRDIADRKLAEKELRLASIVFDNALEGIVITDKNGNILRINNALVEITGYEKKDLFGWNIREIPIFRIKEEIIYSIWEKAVKNGKWQGELTVLKKSGEEFPAWLSIIQVKNKDEVTNYIVMISDITRRKYRERKLKNLAYYDNLTKLPNRVYFFSKLKYVIDKSIEEGSRVALFFIDLDGFKQVNDTYGHEMGDKLLKEVAKRLKSSVRKDDFVARLAGDEFVILIEGVDSRDVLKKISEKIITNVGKPYYIDGYEITIGTSIGISILPDDAQDIETFLKHADFAMYHSKLMGKNRFTFYSDIIHKSA